MSLTELSVKDFLRQVDSSNPTPGGGSVAAATIAYGIGLLRMVAHLSMNKKRFQNLTEEIKADYLQRFSKLEVLKEETLKLVDLDTLAFNKIMAAFRLPKDTDDEINLRKASIKEATITAIEVPLKTAKLALEAFNQAQTMFEYANKSATSDFGVGALLLDAGLEGALLNVKTNLVDFGDMQYKEACLQECSMILKEAKEIKDQILEKVLFELN
ncbi:MAG: cyclodeaminase/cyclohydrolase family protein [Bacilli bacterium]|nr:cyclodeaminase/cyclohydrolase family protein [Bacilli bacterium]